MTSKVLVTGAAGFTGRHLGGELAAHGLTCVGVLSHAGDAVPCSYATTHVADLLDGVRLAELLQVVQPRYVIHLAAVAFVAHGSAEEIYRTNIVGTRNLLEAIAALPEPPELTLLASSANVYGNAGVEVITEDTPPSPANDYAVSKLAMEHLASLYAGRLPLVLVRPFNYTGVGQSENFLIPKVVAHASRRAPLIELGNLDVARDFSDVRMVVECYRRLLSCPSAVGKTVNVCSGQAHSLRKILQCVEELSGHRLPVAVNTAFVRASEVKTMRGSRARLETLIGPVHDIPLVDTLAWMLESDGESFASGR